MIRHEEPDDIDAIRALNVEAFGQSEEADIVDTLRRNRVELLSLVAVESDEVVGHILFTPVTIEGEGRTLDGYGLGPMAVRPDRQRTGIGSELVRVGMKELEQRNTPFVVVLGHPEYYPRFGFEPAGRRGIRCEWPVPDDVFMIRVVREPDLADIEGLARYRPEFSGEA